MYSLTRERSTALQLQLAGIVKESIVDGPSLRLTLFAQGCPHYCLGCHNPHTHSTRGGTTISIDSIMEVITANPLLDGITLSGGEPFQQPQACAEIARRAKSLGLHIMTYTGFTYERIVASQDVRPGWRELLERTDLLVDGPFLLEQRNSQLLFRGSDNQRLIDVAASLQSNAVCIAQV